MAEGHNDDSEQLLKDRNETEFKWMKQRADEIVAKITPDKQFNEKYLLELMRFSDSKIHTVSAFMGGIASQEVIKILLKQYTIINHTLIYDGIHGRCEVFDC